MSDFWFPVAEDLLLDNEFMACSPAEKLYYFSLLHYMDLSVRDRGLPFYQRDLDFAAALNYSEEAIKKARRKFTKMGWLDVTSGFRTKVGKGVATTYNAVKWRESPDPKSGKRFVPFPHYDFEMMLQILRRGDLKHADIVVYVFIVCWKYLKGDQKEVYISKNDLRNFTNIVQAVECARRVAGYGIYSDGLSAFDCVDLYHKLNFTNFAFASSPITNENNRKSFQEFKQHREQVAQSLSKQKREKEAGKTRQQALDAGIILSVSELPLLFSRLHKAEYDKYPTPEQSQRRKLENLAEQYGIQKVEAAIYEYFRLPNGKIPARTGTKKKTLGRFLDIAEDFFEPQLTGKK